MKKLFALFAVLRPGRSVANPELWKHGGAALQAALVPFLLAVVAAVCTVFGVCLDVAPQTAAGIAGGIVAVVGVFVTYATSDKVGLPGLAPAQPDAGAGRDVAAPGAAPAAAAVGSGPADVRAPAAVRPRTEADREAP